jgi:hypothetical protein
MNDLSKNYVLDDESKKIADKLKRQIMYQARGHSVSQFENNFRIFYRN